MINKDRIIDAVCTAYEADYNLIKSASRKRKYVNVRFAICWFMRNNTRLTLYEIGELIKRKHSDVVHAIREYDNLLFYDKNTQQKHNKIIKLLQGSFDNKRIEKLIEELEIW